GGPAPGQRLAAPDPAPAAGPHDLLLSSPARGPREAAATVATPAVRAHAPLVSATAGRTDRRHRRDVRTRAARLHAARQGVPARAGRGRYLAAREVPHRHLAGGCQPVRPRHPRATADLP